MKNPIEAYARARLRWQLAICAAALLVMFYAAPALIGIPFAALTDAPR